MSALKFGMQVHYTSKLKPFIESPATVLMRECDYITGGTDLQISNEHHLHLLVHGAHNDYREFDIIQARMVGEPGSWHFEDDMNQCAIDPAVEL